MKIQHYQKITKWKTKAGNRCRHCRQEVDEKKDYFTLKAHWKIKKKADEYTFCSINCVREWAKEDKEE